MVQGSQIRKYVYEAVPYASEYPDRLKCQVIGDEIRIVQYTATDLRLIDNARMAYGYQGTIWRYDGMITNVFAKYGIKVVCITKSEERQNSSHILTIKFVEVPVPPAPQKWEPEHTVILGIMIFGAIGLAFLVGLAIFG